MNTKTKTYWANQMEGLFEAHNYFPELEMMGAGCFVFTPKGGVGVYLTP